MIVLDRRKYSPEGDNGSAGSGASDNPNPTENPSGDGSEGKSSSGSGKSGDFVFKKEILDSYKADLAKWKARAKENEKRLADIDAAKASEEEQKLLEEKKYQELLEKRDAEIAELRGQHQDLNSKIDSFKNREIMGEKVSAFLDQADYKVDKKYLSFVDFDSITLSDDGSVVASSVKDVVDKFRNDHPTLILGKTKTPKHHQPGSDTSAKLTKREYHELYRRDQHAARQAVFDGRVLDT